MIKNCVLEIVVDMPSVSANNVFHNKFYQWNIVNTSFKPQTSAGIIISEPKNIRFWKTFYGITSVKTSPLNCVHKVQFQK